MFQKEARVVALVVVVVVVVVVLVLLSRRGPFRLATAQSPSSLTVSELVCGVVNVVETCFPPSVVAER